MVPRAIAFVCLLVVPLLAGCTDGPPAQPETLLVRTEEFGHDLYAYGVPDFHGSEAGHERRLRASFVVPDGVETVGVRFVGTLAWENSTALLSVAGPDGRAVLALNATRGRTDDHGEIRDVFQFRPVVPMQPGRHEITATGRGNVSHLEFRFVGIERGPAAFEDTFTVGSDTRRITLRLFVEGWGATPRATLVPPSGAHVPLVIEGASGDVTERFTPTRGTYEIHVDTSGWAGRIAVQVIQGDGHSG